MVRGKFNGLGTYFLRNGEKYEGKFLDNRYNGYGKFYHINILEGIFINDQPNGGCILHKPDVTTELHIFWMKLLVILLYVKLI